MSSNDQRPRGQPSHVSNGSSGKEEEAYLQQQPPHPIRAWSEQASDGGYGAGPMSTAVSDSFFPNYYPPNMSYPFMSQGMGGSEGAWSSGADTMFGMGYDYSNMYSGFGFPFNNWDYSNDYWSNSQPVRKDQRGYAAEDAYYPPEMIPADSYGIVNGGGPPPTATATATATPAGETQEPVVNVEQGIRDMRLGYRKDNVIPQPQQSQRQQQQPPQQQQQPPPPQHHLQHVVAEGFGGEPSFMMPPSPVTATAVSSGGQSPMSAGNNSSSSNSGGGDQCSGQSSSKKTSWAAIASQPARPQLQMRPRTIPRAPVHPGKSHNMDIGTWDTRGNPSRTVPMTMSQPLPNQPPSSIAARYSRQPLIGQRQGVPLAASASVTVSNSSNNNSSGGSVNASGANNTSNLNSSSSYNSGNNTAVDNGSGSNVTSDSSNATTVSSDSSSVVTAIGTSADSNNSNNLSNNTSGGGNNSASSSSAYSGGYTSSTSGNTSDSANSRAVVNVNASMNGTHGSGADPSPSAQAPAPVADAASSEKMPSSSFYNPKEFVLNHKSARYFIIKSYSEDDIHRSIKYAVWCSTDHGNRRLDAAFREREGKGPVYLIFSVNGSGHFCGVAQMMTPVDYNKNTGIWHQDKWKGQIEVKWVYVKDVPNGQLRHIRLENNENKPVTNSRDTQEVPPEKGKQVLRIMHSYKATTSIFDDFSHYEKRQEEDRLLSMHREQRGGGHHGHSGGGDRRGGDGGDYHGGGGNRDRGDRDHHQHHHRGGDRGERDNHHNHHRGGNSDNHHNYRNDYNNRGGDRDGGGRDNRDQHHHRYDGRGGENRNDNRDRGGPRGGFDREIRGRPGGMNDRDNRRGGFRQH